MKLSKVFRQKIQLFASRENLSEMLSHSDIDLRSIGEKPTVVYIVIQDEKKTYHSLVTILLKQIYETLISVAQEHGGSLPVRTNFLLDEFANMPPLKDVTTMITAARSRQIRFTMIIQNFAQLEQVYGKEQAETLRGNCGNLIYLVTTELKALEEISKMCGEVKSKKDDKTASTPLVTVTDLQKMKENEVIILRLRMSPFKTKFTPNYKINWGESFPKAKYPVREKQQVSVFDIKGFVKDQKKKKLLEMMNSAENDDKNSDNTPFGGSMMPGGMFPPFGGSMPGINRDIMSGMKKPNNSPFVNNSSNMASSFGERPNNMGMPFGGKPNNNMNGFPPFMNENPMSSNNSPVDIDDLVKKIDQKIAELEEEERLEKEKLKKESKETTSQVTEAKVEDDNIKLDPNKDQVESEILQSDSSVSSPLKEEKKKEQISLELDDEDDDEFFDDFFDN